MAEPQYLADLWGLSHVQSGASSANVGPPVRLDNGDVEMGSGPIVRSRTDVRIRLPASQAARFGALPQLEAWAMILLSERYTVGRSGGSRLPLRLYYLVRPLLPRAIQIALRRRHARRRTGTSYLHWPFDGLFGALAEAYLAIRLEQEGGNGSISRLWPLGAIAAATLTHDVEGRIGQARTRALADLEAERGLRSCFNFVAERYVLDQALMADLRRRGFEIGVHGIKHDGRKFASRKVFEERLVALQRYQREWGADGFRSPATHRRWEWMSELPFGYDSSYPDTDPYEPIPGGCGSPWPFKIGGVTELPITLPQDHTLWEILQVEAGGVWQEKAAKLRRCGGLINIIVHPDYLSAPDKWRQYEDFLAWLQAQTDIWIALPRDIAKWWQDRQDVRQSASVIQHGAEWEISFQ
jgi:hypothetical protein